MNINPEQALDNLNKAAALVNGTRADHEALMKCVEVLRVLVEADKKKPE